MDELPIWVKNLKEEDFNFILQFIKFSGSLKDLANYYNVTYPTIRLRLDRLIEKIALLEENRDDAFVYLVKEMAIDNKIDYNSAKTIIAAYRKQKGE